MTLLRSLTACFLFGLAPCLAQNLDNSIIPEDPYQGVDDEEAPFGFDLDLTPSLPEEFTLRTNGRITYDPEQETIRYEQPVEITTDTGSQLFADQATVRLKEGLVELTGDVAIYQSATLTRADSAKYYWEDEKIESQSLRTGFPPFYLQTKSLKTVNDEERKILVAEEGQLTTHDAAKPSFWFKARELSIVPEERFVFRDMNFEVEGKNYFYFPYLNQNFDREMGFQILPGARNIWGPFVSLSYGYPLGGNKDPETGVVSQPDYTLRGLLDLRARRGVGLGFELLDRDHSRNSELGKFSAYFTHDLDPSVQRTQIPRGNLDPSRYRVAVGQRWEFDTLEDFDPQAEWYFDANLSWFSDRFILEDFFLNEFQRDPSPDNTLALVRQSDSSVLTLLGRVRLNDFYTTDTRSPEIFFDQVRRPIFGSKMLHEGQTRLGILQEELPGFRIRELQAELAQLPANDPRIAEIQARLSPFGYTRFHTYQELSAPLKYDNWLSLVPRFGAGFTQYQNIDSPLESDQRSLVTLALDASAKWSKSYPQLQNRTWGIDGLVHTVQPYFSASYVATDELDSSFSPIDRLVSTTRPRPINVGRFTAIDEIRDWTVLRTGVRNLLMTKRDDQSHQWLSWDLYVDAFLEDPEFDRNFSNLYSEIQWSPVPWSRLGIESQLPVFGEESEFVEFNTSASFMPDENLEIQLSHRFLENHPILLDSNLLILRLFYRWNDEWGFGAFHRWEFDDNTLEEQRYSISRDFGSWTSSIGVFHRDNRARDEYGFLLGFTLKALPDVNVPVSIDAN